MLKKRISQALIILIIFRTGYLTRAVVGTEYKFHAFNAGQKRILSDIKREIGKGYDFIISIEDVTVNFVPRKDGRVNI